ncbi:hypothetical protein HKX48_006739 [Thoreauomyces humboldtii]|nr:hypothetical protein HKX48_006739 [Thoreauomyces humboldtii]
MSTSQPPPKTFSLQDTLPRLPIPELKDTARLYLQTLRPVLTPEEYTQSEANVTEFIKAGGAGEIRQTRLHQVDKEEPNSWLERWWLSLAYHGWREAVMINSNWFMSLRNHPETPAELLRGEKMTAQFTDFQVKRAAGFVSNLLNYKAQLDT